MVDATDLKSVDFCDREGSSPSIPIKSKKKNLTEIRTFLLTLCSPNLLKEKPMQRDFILTKKFLKFFSVFFE